jgi:hypothetical protein
VKKTRWVKSPPNRAKIKLVENYVLQGWSLGVAVAKSGIGGACWHSWAQEDQEIREIRRKHEELRKSGFFSIAKSNLSEVRSNNGS